MPETQKPIRIVIADDHEIFRLGLRSVIEESSALEVVAEAANGIEAIDCVQKHRPHILFLDVAMPVMDGIAAAQNIRDKKLDVQVIMLTADASSETVLASLSSGAQGYCLKTVSPERLFAGIECVQLGDIWIDREIAITVRQTICGRFNSAAPSHQRESFEPLGDVPLTAKELEILDLMVEGYTNTEIANRLQRSSTTIKNHVASILKKLSASDRTVAAVKALRAGLIS